MTRACLQPAQTLARPTPHQTIHRAKLRAGQGSLVDGKLLAKGEVLEGELTVTAEEEGEEPEQLE
jgi:hypothetical protein